MKGAVVPTDRAIPRTQTASITQSVHRRGLLGALIGAAITMTSAASAHDFWIQPDSFWIPAGAATGLTVLVGHGTYRETSLIALDRVMRFTNDASIGRVDMRSSLKLGDARSRTELRFPQSGLQVLGLETNGAYSDLPGLRFTDYLKVEGLTPALEARARAHQMDAPGREIYSRRAKALIQSGPASSTDDQRATRPVGLSLEIVPEKNPYSPAFDGQLPVQILYEGRPLAGALVKLNNLDFDSRPIASQLSDRDGRTIFHVPRIGLWQLNVIWTRPIKGDPKADFQTTFSSLSFGFSRASPQAPLPAPRR